MNSGDTDSGKKYKRDIRELYRPEISKIESHIRRLQNIGIDKGTASQKLGLAAGSYGQIGQELADVYTKLGDLYDKLETGRFGKEEKKENSQLIRRAEDLEKKYGKHGKILKIFGTSRKEKAGKGAENLEGIVEDITAAVLALAGVFFILAPESPAITGFAVLNITNPINTSLSMAFGIVLIATSLFLLLRKK